MWCPVKPTVINARQPRCRAVIYLSSVKKAGLVSRWPGVPCEGTKARCHEEVRYSFIFYSGAAYPITRVGTQATAGRSSAFTVTLYSEGSIIVQIEYWLNLAVVTTRQRFSVSCMAQISASIVFAYSECSTSFN